MTTNVKSHLAHTRGVFLTDREICSKEALGRTSHFHCVATAFVSYNKAE